MATRFYLPSSGAAAVSPAIDAGWEFAGGTVRRKCVVTKIASAFATQAPGGTTAATNQDCLFVQYVSDPVPAGDISGTIKGIIRVWESNVGLDARAQLIAKVVSNDGATVRGTLLAMDTSALASEWATVATNRKFPLAWAGAGATLTLVTAQADDRIVLEVGGRMHANFGAFTLRADLGDAGASDLLEDETSTDQLNSWIEFSQTIWPASTGWRDLTLLGAG